MPSAAAAVLPTVSRGFFGILRGDRRVQVAEVMSSRGRESVSALSVENKRSAKKNCTSKEGT